MIKKIQYIFDNEINNFTCHALFSTITSKKLENMKINCHTKQPEYSVSYQDRVITIIINEEDFGIVFDQQYFENNNFETLVFQNEGKNIVGKLWKNENYQNKSNYELNDYVKARGFISYAINLSENLKKKNICPIKPNGTFVNGTRQKTLDYLEDRLGIDLRNEQINQRDFRFEMISYKHFELKNKILSKSNNQILSLHNVFSFEVEGFVKDLKINNLEISSIGKKRTYGLGNIEIT